MDRNKQTVLIVDDVPENIQILLEILSDTYAVISATNGKKALSLALSSPPDIILLDIMMPEIDGYQVCRELKNDVSTKDIPIIFVTAKNDEIDEEIGLELGAVDYISKPINPYLVVLRVKSQLELKKHRDDLEEIVKLRTLEIEETRLDIIRKLGKAAEFKDDDTGQHVIRMSRYSYLIAQAYGLPEKECELILQASPMHDLGKIGIPDKILQKPGKLDPEEWKIIQTHAQVGANILGTHHSELINVATIIAVQHHEKWDGSGYPKGLKNKNIHIYARIVAVADVFDALTSKRPYKEAWPIARALDVMRETIGTHFDPKVFAAFESILDEILKIQSEHS
ncbi:MAG: response regulator [Fibrobacterales bacterium]